MDGDKLVWVPHPTEGFTLGRIVDIGSDTITVDAKGQVSVTADWWWTPQSQGLYGALEVLKSLEFDWTKLKVLNSLNFTK